MNVVYGRIFILCATLILFGQSVFASCNVPPRGEPINVDECGAVGNGTTDDFDAITKAIIFSANNGIGLVFSESKDYAIRATLEISNDTSRVPAYIDGRGAVLSPHANFVSGSGPLVKLVNPHGGASTPTSYKRHNFALRNLTLDSDDLATNGLHIFGGQHMEIEGLDVRNAQDAGVLFESQSGHGIYYSSIRNINSFKNGAEGIKIKNSDTLPARRTGNVNFYNVHATCNHGHGYSIEYANVSFFGSSAEKNDGYGYYVRDTRTTDIIGGYLENNHRGFAAADCASGFTPDPANPAQPIKITAAAIQVNVLGGRRTDPVFIVDPPHPSSNHVILPAD